MLDSLLNIVTFGLYGRMKLKQGKSENGGAVSEVESDEQKNNEIDQWLLELEKCEGELCKLGRELFKERASKHDGDASLNDVFTISVINRAVQLSSGFRALIKERNKACAGALARLQLDTAFRYAAGVLVEDRNQFVHQVMLGKQIKDMKDRNGKWMTDRYLLEKMIENYPTTLDDHVIEIYEECCNYIHFSHVHFTNAFIDERRKGNKIIGKVKMGEQDAESFSDNECINMAGMFGIATEILKLCIRDSVDGKLNSLGETKT